MLDDIQGNLRILNISGLRLTKLSVVKGLRNLKVLLASNNRFSIAQHIADCIQAMPDLVKAEFRDCPAQLNDSYYRSKIIASSVKLGLRIQFSCFSRASIFIFQ